MGFRTVAVLHADAAHRWRAGQPPDERVLQMLKVAAGALGYERVKKDAP